MMKRGVSMLVGALAGALLSGCGGAVLDAEDADDHAAEAMTFEGASVTDRLGPGGESAPVAVTGGFARLGVLWDASDAEALELRTSLDGKTWSSWARPQQISAEEGARAGLLDARGAYYQYRVLPGRAAPSFVSFEPLARVPQPVTGPVAAPPEGEGAGIDTPEGVAALAQGLSTPIGALTIHSRSEWGGRAPRCSSATSPYRAAIHHTVTPTSDSLSPAARLRQIQNYHMDVQGWCDIGYNYLVSRDGRVWRGRGATTLGAHASGANTGNIGISFLGTYTSSGVSATQQCSGAKLLARLHQDFPALSLNRTDVKGHRQYGGTACPGDALYRQIDAIVRKASKGCGG